MSALPNKFAGLIDRKKGPVEILPNQIIGAERQEELDATRCERTGCETKAPGPGPPVCQKARTNSASPPGPTGVSPIREKAF